MPEWDPKAVRKDLGLSRGGFEGVKRPKGLIHTTEGFTLDSAMGAYRGNGYAPHVTIGPHPAGGERTQRWQHYPFSSRSSTLADASGGVRTNRLWVYQVEVVGTCDDKWKSGKWAWLHVDNWPAWYRDDVADLMADWEDWFGIPRRSSVRFAPYPSSYGKGASQRLSGTEFTAYTGWLGHQHAPENTHGDPGDLVITDLFRRMARKDTPPPATEDDMPSPADLWDHKLSPGPTADAIGGYPTEASYPARDLLIGADARLRRLETTVQAQYEAVLTNVQQEDPRWRDQAAHNAAVATMLSALSDQLTAVAALVTERLSQDGQS